MKPTQFTHGAALILLLALAACQGDDQLSEVPGTQDPDAPIEFPLSRSTTGDESDEAATVFQDGVEIGISVKYNSYDYNNMKYKYSSEEGKFVPAEPSEGIYYGKNNEFNMTRNATYRAYYPYREDGDYTQPTILSDQSTEQGYYASDLLEAEGNLRQALQFKHRMAKVMIEVGQPMQAVTLTGQPLTENGQELQDVKALKADEEGKLWKAILPPGTRSLTAELTKQANGKTYDITFDEETLTAGSQHTFTVERILERDDQGRIIIELAEYSYTITTPEKYLIRQSNPGTQVANGVTIDCDGAEIYIEDQTFNTSTRLFTAGNGAKGGTIPIYVTGECKAECANFFTLGDNGVYLRDGSKFILKGTDRASSKLTIKSTGIGIGVTDWHHIETMEISTLNLNIESGSVCIGGGYNSAFSDLKIDNCTVVAKSNGRNSAAIGTIGNSIDLNYYRHEKNITISNSTVTATRGPVESDSPGADIGAGGSDQAYRTRCGDITLNDVSFEKTTHIGKSDVTPHETENANYVSQCGKIYIDGELAGENDEVVIAINP